MKFADWRERAAARDIGAPCAPDAAAASPARQRIPASVKRRLRRLSSSARVAVVQGNASLYRRRPFVGALAGGNDSGIRGAS